MDFRSSTLPLYYVSKAIGLATFSYNNKEKGTSNPVSPSVLWSLFIFLIHLTALISIMIWSILYDYSAYSLNVTVPDGLTIVLMYLTCFISITVGAVFNRRRMELLMTSFSLIDKILLRANRDAIYRKTRTILLFEISAIVVIFTGFYCYQLHVWTYGTSYIYIAAKDLTNFSNVVMVVQYVNVVQMLRHRFRVLNQQIATSCNSSTKHPSVRIVSNNRTIQSETPISQIFFLSEFTMPINNHRPEEMSRIHTLRQTYTDLCDVTELINQIYGYDILFEVAYDFVSLVSYLYYVLDTLSNETNMGTRSQRGQDSRVPEVVSSLCWVSQNLVRALCITASCFATTEEAHRTRTVVQKLLLRQTLDGSTSEELQLFSMQLLSSKVHFTAGGFFSVDLSLVYSMVGAATTYIIILLQFK
jgi:gustatory receptor